MALGIIQALDAATAGEDPDQVYRDIQAVADQIESIACSIREDAYRRNGCWLRIHRAEFVQQAQLLVSLIRDVATIDSVIAK